MPPRNTRRSNYGDAQDVLPPGDAVSRPTLLSGVVGAGWVRVLFGRAGTYASRSFSVYSPTKAVVVRVVDLYCPGDVFALVAGRPGGGPLRRLARSSHATGDRCATSTPDEEAALRSGAWSALQVQLPPGRYVLSVEALASPHGGGEAAVRFDYASPGKAGDDRRAEGGVRWRDGGLGGADVFGPRDAWGGDALVYPSAYSRRSTREDTSASTSTEESAPAPGLAALARTLGVPGAASGACAGYGGYFVARARRVEDVAGRASERCAALGGTVAGPLPGPDEAALGDVVRTLRKCIPPAASGVAWAASDEPDDSGRVPAVRASSIPDNMEVRATLLAPGDACAVLCVNGTEA